MKATGFMVFERCEDFEQGLVLETARHLPPGGVLGWATREEPRAVFTSRKAARAAIVRTEHYRLAFGAQYPEAKFCVIVPVVSVASEAA